jgi:hypothetical protein
MRVVIVGTLAIIGAVSGRFYFEEDFNDIAWKERWTARARPSSLVIADAQAVPHLLLTSFIYKTGGRWRMEVDSRGVSR